MLNNKKTEHSISKDTAQIKKRQKTEMAQNGSNSTVKLLGTWSSPFALRARIALHLKSVEYEYIEEADVLKSKSDLLLKSNPIHKKVPVLIHGDVSICESLNIVQYVDESWPSKPSILPSEPKDRAFARFWAHFVDGKCFETIDAVAGAKDDTGRMAAAGNLMESLAALEEAFQKGSKGGDFFGGEDIGFVDIACGAIVGPLSVIEAFSGVKFLNPDTTPGLMQWAERFRAHEAVKPYMPTVAEFVEFAKQKFNVQ
ncbi:unnamed protein product [Thlaspi arvense]|uniref:glutathione transferase n=1 Tax=Thlaspi arvense TaxID=13288 RepID=A0AAU9SMK6_THLAR|nr:unnamed protein product [Thlaspi arvense]